MLTPYFITVNVKQDYCADLFLKSKYTLQTRWEGGRSLSDKSADKKQDRENIFFSVTSGDEQNFKVCCPQ